MTDPLPSYRDNVESFLAAANVEVLPDNWETLRQSLLSILEPILQKPDDQRSLYESSLLMFCSHNWKDWSGFTTSSQPTFPIGEFMTKLEVLVKAIEDDNARERNFYLCCFLVLLGVSVAFYLL